MEAGEFEYTIATEADRESVRDALAAYFYPEEPLTLAHRDGPAVTQDDMEHALSFLATGTTVLAHSRTEGKLVGLSIGGLGGAAAEKGAVTVTTRKFADIVAFLECLNVRAYGEPNVTLSYHVHALAVHPMYRAHSIGRRLVEEQVALARARWPTMSTIAVEATGPGSCRLMKRLGMRETARLSFANYNDDVGEQIFLGSGEVVALEMKL
uniref:N-acetyltransferase domain-containing protein n=1 Tax=Anopheles epiroticus TaxID=199890 RepID=A0A182PB77_9DIPT